MPKYGEGKKFQPQDFPHSGSKAKDVKEERKIRAKVGNNNGQLRIANTTLGGTYKPPGPMFTRL